MATLSYPLVCWQLDDTSVCGILLGTDFQVIERNARRVKAALAETLQRERERDGYVPEPDIDNARLKLVHVPVNLAHRTEKAASGAPRNGLPRGRRVRRERGRRLRQCYLPWLDQSFYYSTTRSCRC